MYESTDHNQPAGPYNANYDNVMWSVSGSVSDSNTYADKYMQISSLICINIMYVIDYDYISGHFIVFSLDLAYACWQ